MANATWESDCAARGRMLTRDSTAVIRFGTVSLPRGTSVLAGQTNIAGTTRRRRSGCIISTTESIRLSGRVNILGTVRLQDE